MDNKGWWIKLYASLTQWEWYDDISVCRLYIHLLLTVNTQDKQWKGITIHRGERVTSRQKLADETGLSVQQVRTAIKKLISTDNITIVTTNKWMLVRVENYALGQDSSESINQQNNQQRNKRATTKQPSINHQSTTTIDYIDIKTNRLIDIYIGASSELMDAIKSFEDMRKKKKKPMTDRARKMLWNRLNKLASVDGEFDEQLAIKLLDDAIMHSWDTVYESSIQKDKSQGGLAYTMDMFD